MIHKTIDLQVGESFPEPIPRHGFVTLEFWGVHPVVLIHFPHIPQSGIQAFNTMFEEYAYFESDNFSVPMALWVFKFASPIDMVEVNFDVKQVDAESIATYLENETASWSRTFTFMLLDHQNIKGIQVAELAPKATRLFRHTIRRQLSRNYTPETYAYYMKHLRWFSMDEIFEMGSHFKYARH